MNDSHNSLKEIFKDKSMQQLYNLLKKIDISKVSHLNEDDIAFSLFLSHKEEFDFYDCCDIFRRIYIISTSNSNNISKQKQNRYLGCIKYILVYLEFEKDICLSICEHHELPKNDIDFLKEFKPSELRKYINTLLNESGDIKV